jgi:hypothetical protein
MTLTIILNVVLMAIVFAAIVGLLSAGIASNRRWAASLASPIRRRARVRTGARVAGGRRGRRGEYAPAR